MPSELDELRATFRQLTHDYISALQNQELAPLDSLSALTANDWQTATNIADEINGRRLSAREDLLAALRAAT